MKLMRSLIVAGALTGVGVSILPPQSCVAQDQAAMQLSEEQLGESLAALGIEAEKKQQRYDFAFRAVMSEEEWELSMSAVLSQNGEDLWVMAWLDELPKTSAEVPKTALLRLLAQNDQLGNGKFFAYVPTARRFVLQRTVPNEDLTSAKLRVILQDLGSTVVENYPIWAVANWNPTGTPAAPTGAPAQSASQSGGQQFQQPVQR
ncbi:type III secretion system chaperone [Thalassoglobus sp. JC818]|uniref:type III secretion system chaperone n=1 Tax=Thalassoglobus sp. JC818 TaxID=3232136 RepID=UPI00345AE3E3